MRNGLLLALTKSYKIAACYYRKIEPIYLIIIDLQQNADIISILNQEIGDGLS